MKYRVNLSILSVISCLAGAALVGCGGSSSSSSSGPAPAINGNYDITATSTVNAGVKSEVGGQLSSSAGAVSGIVHFLSSPCIDLHADVSVSGSVKSGGALTLTSASIANQVITIKAQVSQDGSTITSGSYSIAGGCGDKDQGTISGFKVPTINGTYSGTFTSSLSGRQIQTTVQLSQMSGVDADGYLHFTSTGTFVSTCPFTQGSTVEPLSDSLLVGSEGFALFTTNETGISHITASGSFDSTGKTLTGIYGISGGGCDGDRGTGTLTLQ